MVMNTVIIMEMIALTITIMGAMMNRVFKRNKMLKKSLKIAKTITRMIMRNTMSIIVWMIMRKITKMMRIMVTTNGQNAFDLHKVYKGH